MAQGAAQAVESKGQRRRLLALVAAIFMINLDARVVTPLLPTIAADLRTTVSATGGIVTAYVLPSGLFQLVYGPLADRLGKVTVVAWAMVPFSVGTALCGPTPALPAIVALHFLTLAYVGDTVPYARRPATIALLATSTTVASSCSTAASGLLAAAVSWRFVFPVFLRRGAARPADAAPPPARLHRGAGL